MSECDYYDHKFVNGICVRKMCGMDEKSGKKKDYSNTILGLGLSFTFLIVAIVWAYGVNKLMD